MSIIWTVGRLKAEGWYRTAIKLTPLTRIHIFWRGDNDRAHHDHPNDFWTFPLIGYWEEVTDLERPDFFQVLYVKPWRLHFRPAEYRHRVLGRKLIPGWFNGFITIVREMPARRSWGFYPRGEFVHWREYLNVEET